MIKIAVTPPDVDNSTEARDITAILDAGWDRVHLRHPRASDSDVRRVIDNVPEEYHRKLVLHDNFNLLAEYNLAGVHLNHRNPAPPVRYTGSVSRSCHSIEELMTQPASMAYVTLSPIFDSISKPGYKAAFTVDELSRVSSLTDVKVIALGGVTPDKIGLLERYGFAGYAVLGRLPWGKDPDTMRLILNEYR